MQTLVEDFLQYLRHERGQAEHTQKTYAGLLNKFTTWAGQNGLTEWRQVELKQLRQVGKEAKVIGTCVSF